MRFVLITKTPYIHLLLSFCLGMAGIILVHFAVLYWGPQYPSDVWLKSPYLSPNMRDIGDLATAAIAILGAMYCFSRQPLQSAGLLLLFTVTWAYLLWSGGRTAIASAVIVNVLTLFICRFYAGMAWQKTAFTVLALVLAYFLCSTLSIYDWNGIVRYSSEWQQNNPEFNGDASSGRIEMWAWSIDVFLRKPWLGYGPYGFYFLPERFSHQFYHDHPHNLFIQCLSEWGIIGTTLFMAFLLGLAAEGVRQMKSMIMNQNTGYIAAAGIVLMLTLGSLTGGSYWDFQPVIILAVALAGFPFLPTFANTDKAMLKHSHT
jgi:O-antigen ligase